MPSHDTHCKETLGKLGFRYDEVHRYLDSYFILFGYAHRFMLHHKEGVEEVRRQFGEKAALVAELHIKADCNNNVPSKSDYIDGVVDACGSLLNKNTITKGEKNEHNKSKG